MFPISVQWMGIGRNLSGIGFKLLVRNKHTLAVIVGTPPHHQLIKFV